MVRVRRGPLVLRRKLGPVHGRLHAECLHIGLKGVPGGDLRRDFRVCQCLFHGGGRILGQLGVIGDGGEGLQPGQKLHRLLPPLAGDPVSLPQAVHVGMVQVAQTIPPRTLLARVLPGALPAYGVQHDCLRLLAGLRQVPHHHGQRVISDPDHIALHQVAVTAQGLDAGKVRRTVRQGGGEAGGVHIEGAVLHHQPAPVCHLPLPLPVGLRRRGQGPVQERLELGFLHDIVVALWQDVALIAT